MEDIDHELTNPTDKRLFAISMAFHSGYSVEKIWQMTNIDKWFLTKLENIYKTELTLTYVLTERCQNYLSLHIFTQGV